MKVRTARVRPPLTRPGLAAGRSFSERRRLLQRRRRQQFWHRCLLGSPWLVGVLLVFLLSVAAVMTMK